MTTRRQTTALLATLGCAPALAGTHQVIDAFAREGVRFTIPDGWWFEDAPDGGALQLFSQVIDGGVDASAIIELPTVVQASVVDERLRSALERKRRTLRNYVERVATRGQTKKGLWYSVLEYEAEVKSVEVVERLAYLLLPRSRYSHFFTSMSRRTERKHMPQVEAFLNSISAAG